METPLRIEPAGPSAEADHLPPAREVRTREIGREIFAAAMERRRGTSGLDEDLLAWTMHHPGIRSALFRLVDVLPALASRAEVASHLQSHLLEQPASRELPAPLRLALRLSSAGPAASGLAAWAARRGVRRLARRFIAGESAAEAAATVHRLSRSGMGSTLDLLGEVVTSDDEADAYVRRYLALIDAIGRAPHEEVIRADGDAPRPAAADRNSRRDGSFPCSRAEVSLKLTALDPALDAIAPRGGRVISTGMAAAGSFDGEEFVMRFMGVGIVLALLVSSSWARATVYVWNDPDGALVMTNDTKDVPEEAAGSVKTYSSTSDTAPPPKSDATNAANVANATTGSTPRATTDAGTGKAAAQQPQPAAPAPDEEASAPTHRAERDPRASSPAVRQAAPPGPAGVVTSAAGAPQPRALAPGASAETAASRRAPGQTGSDPLSTAAVSPRERPAIDPRSLIDPAARQDPPRVIVSVVSPSARPLSTSDRARAPSSGDVRGRGASSSPLGAPSLLGDGGSSLGSTLSSPGSER